MVAMPSPRTRRTYGLLVVVAVLIGVVIADETSRQALVIQARLIAGVPPAHPHWLVPWFRAGGCLVPLQPEVCITSDDYAWLVKRRPADWGVWLAAATDTWDDPGSDCTADAIRRQQAPLRAEYAATAERLERDSAAPCAARLAVGLAALPRPLRAPTSGLHPPTPKLTAEQIRPLLGTIRRGEARDGGNAYWPLMRMAVRAEAGHFPAALAALEQAQWRPRYDDYGRWAMEAIQGAWEPYGVPRAVTAARPPNVYTGTEHISVALELLVQHAARREQAGDVAAADTIYAAVIETGRLAFPDDREPERELLRPVRALPRLRQSVLRPEAADAPEHDTQSCLALESLVSDLVHRQRPDLARAVVAYARESHSAVGRWKQRERDLEPLFGSLTTGATLWWLQGLLMAGGAWLLVVATGLSGMARSARRGWRHWRGALAALGAAALCGLYVIAAGLYVPPHSLLSVGDESAMAEAASAVALLLVWLLPIGLGLLCWRSTRRVEMEPTLTRLAAVRVALVQIALCAFALALIGVQYRQHVYEAAERLFPFW